ncbi:MAG TPA: PEP-CTERM sorting domain-containing protein [Aquabacterium sp.]|uniref:PEP-CTERM sorting domain-containing protein n=1 Tax=Aquabacterium sp. TaxID=1872578 RepID=UPI002E329352|nr:PEP-CTERM sorting domain-containing protein [Aquabacterium sp.]HEX5355040.1 PEP-CTERM sorting domain-containing protein [Aquabacterium sp.]
MYRITTVMLAAAVASTTMMASAQAAGATPPYLGDLGYGDQSIVIQPLAPSTNAFVYEARFNLLHDSALTGVLTGIRSGAATVTESWFNEALGQTESRTWARTIAFDGQPFDLGTLPGTAGVVSISPSTYTISLSGVLSDNAAATGATFKLSVTQAVPEPGTWALMGLGLVGLTVARRRRILA